MGLDSADKVWLKDETAALIALYESERSLYDKKDKHYLNAQKRNDGYERIRQVMLRIRPGCTVSDIKSRIKYLRSQYASELLRRNLTIESGLCTKDTYKPVMWCFGLLQFLDDFITTKKSTSNVVSSEWKLTYTYEDEGEQKILCEEKSDEPDTEDDSSSSKITPASKRKSTNLNGISNCSEAEKHVDFEDIEQNKSKKKRKVSSPSSSDSTMDTPEKLSAQNNFDREDIFGQYVASEIRALRDNPLLYLQTKQSILEILTSANFEFINPE